MTWFQPDLSGWGPDDDADPPGWATLDQAREWTRRHPAAACAVCGQRPRRLGGRGRHHAHGPDTEVEAALAVTDLHGKRLAAYELLEAAGERGLTDDEGGAQMGGDRLTFGRRRQELCLEGRARDSGERRLNPAGRRAVVWVLTR